MPKEPVRPKLADIATIAGVSVATVSRVLDDHPAITPPTKARVMAAVVELGYPLRSAQPKRSRPARIRRHRRQHGICVVMPAALPAGSQLANPFELSLLGGIGAAMRDRGLDFALSAQAPYDNQSLLAFAAHHAYDGMIFLGQSQYHDGLNTLADAGQALVVWGIEAPGQRYCSIGGDNFAGARDAVAHLARLGRRRIAVIGPSAPITTAQTGNSQLAERVAGCKAGLAAAGLADDLCIVRRFGPGQQIGAEAVEDLLGRAVAFDAILAFSDPIAAGAIDALLRHRIRVPEDVAVIGYDDSDIARFVRPQLTSVRQDPVLAGELMVAKLLRLMDGMAAGSERLPTSLAIRASCGGTPGLAAAGRGESE